MTARSSEALEILREVWRGQGQDAADLDADCEQQSCKRMADVGFDRFGADEQDLNSAWRATLEREGKLTQTGGSIRDLVLGHPQPRS